MKCERCGKEMTNAVTGRKRRFCSDSCRKAFKRKRTSDERRKKTVKMPRFSLQFAKKRQ